MSPLTKKSGGRGKAGERFLRLYRERQSIIILNDSDHAIAVRRLEKMIEKDPAKNTKDGRELLKLAKSIERYEEKRWPIVVSVPREKRVSGKGGKAK